jgi:hypothetical protein
MLRYRKTVNSFRPADHIAQTLYDAQVETDKTIIIQSVVLLGYYYVDLEDLDGSWHWLGVAISLGHGVGLHRNLKWEKMQKSPFPSTQFAIWRRMWWCIYIREAWLAVSLGRPMRYLIAHWTSFSWLM